MSNKIIRAELETRLKTWAGSQPTKIPVAYEGVAFTKPTDGTYLEAFLLPSDVIDVDVAATRKRYIGIFHINCWARSGKGMGQVEQLAQSIIELFPVLPKTGLVSIESTPYAEKAILDDSGWLVVPVTVEYRYES
jgi:hypothetical protein